MLDQIFKYAPNGFVTVWAKNEAGSITRWFHLSKADALHQVQQAAIDLDACGYDVYFSTCPARSSGEDGAGKARIKAADVTCVPAFFMDIDTLLDGSKLGKRLPAGVSEAVAALDALPCPPTLCVSSGHGVHAYWVLREPMYIASPQDLESAKKLLRSFADAIVSATGFSDCDAHASEPSRVLRVAGTCNHKMGQLLPVEVIERAQSPEYDLKDVQAFLSAQKMRPSEKADNAENNERSASHLDGEQLLGKARRADPLLDAQYCGDWKVRYPSQSEADLALCSKLAFWFQKDAVRIGEIFRQSSLFRVKWDEKHHGDGSTYGQKTVEMAISGCSDVYVPKVGHYQGTRSVPSVSDAMVQELMALHPEKNDRYAWNDIGNGNLFADLYKLSARYVPERSKWAVFDGRIWQFDLGGLAVMQLCKELSDCLLGYALTLTDEKARQEYMRFLSRWQRRSQRETILKDASSVYPLPFASFDRDPMLFNCLNGILNLDNGHFIPHRPEDYLSKLSGVTYEPNAKCERWERFIDEVMQGDAGKARFLQKALGYALTGDARHECFFILYGPSSRNGKGTTMETFARLMGDYGKSAKPDTIAQRQTANGSGPSEDIARLIGARFVNVSEPDKKLVLSAALVKTLTGRDTVTARFLHENSIEFRPEFKLFINTNYLPQVTDVTLFSSGRVMVIPFERHFREDEQDRDLKDILAQPESLSGILNWALAGLRGVIDEGLNPPGAIRLATDEYRERSDKIGRFVTEVLEEHPLGEAVWRMFSHGISPGASPTGSIRRVLRTSTPSCGAMAGLRSAGRLAVRGQRVPFPCCLDFASPSNRYGDSRTRRRQDMRISPCVPVCSGIFRLSQNSIVIARVTKNAGTHWNTLPRGDSQADLIPLLVLIWMPTHAPPCRVLGARNRINKGRILMLNFLVDYVDPTGVDWHTSFQANAGRQHRHLAAGEICRRLKAEGCTPTLIASIPGDYSLEELEQLCSNGLPHSPSPLRVTFELINVDE